MSDDHDGIIRAEDGSFFKERRRAELALRERGEQLRTLINAMPDIVAFKDGEGRWLEANEFDLKLFQLEQVDYRGKKDSELAEFSPFYRDAFLGCEESDEVAWQARKTSRADETIPRPDGPPMVFDIIKVPMFHPDGRRKGLVIVGRDVTERKLAEARLAQYQESLESLVQERTTELAQANALLHAEIVERGRVEEQLRNSLAEKEVLLKEIHHRVKNNLQVVSSLLELQAHSISDEQTRKYFRDSQDRIRSMALIHEKLYQTRDLISIDFGGYVKSLSKYLFDSYVSDPGRIALQVEAGEVALGVDEAIPIGLIINELISNSLKYAFPDGRQGDISIGFSTDSDGCILLTVADNGVGLPPDLEVATTETLGLQVVTILTRQLRGSMEVGRENGTWFALKFRAGCPKNP
ncbi:MAG: PAS domain-containing protein [Desulfuromonadales bacterium]|nr:PAS domain-containing protein [Desulfuromonadales bacterium]